MFTETSGQGKIRAARHVYSFGYRKGFTLYLCPAWPEFPCYLPPPTGPNSTGTQA